MRKLLLTFLFLTFGANLTTANDSQIKKEVSDSCKKLIRIQANAYHQAIEVIQDMHKENHGKFADQEAVDAWELIGETWMDVNQKCGGKNPLY